jgi:hypothetical protein
MRNEQPLISRYLDTNGNGTGTTNFIGNHANVEAYIQPASEQIFYIARMIISIEDDGGFAAGDYGSLAALTNGIEIKEEDDQGVVTDFTDGVAIKTAGQWAQLCFDSDVKAWVASPTEEVFVVRYTFERSGRGIFLDADEGGKLVVYLNDDFTGLLSHRFLAQGYVARIDKPNP